MAVWPLPPVVTEQSANVGKSSFLQTHGHPIGNTSILAFMTNPFHDQSMVSAYPVSIAFAGLSDSAFARDRTKKTRRLAGFHKYDT